MINEVHIFPKSKSECNSALLLLLLSLLLLCILTSDPGKLSKDDMHLCKKQVHPVEDIRRSRATLTVEGLNCVRNWDARRKKSGHQII